MRAYPSSGPATERFNQMETSTSAYPLQLTGELSPQLSRGLWLVKRLLAIPLHRPRVPLDPIRRRKRCRVLRCPLHRPLPARLVRVQRRRAPLDLASRLLQLQRARHRQVPALHAQRHARRRADTSIPTEKSSSSVSTSSLPKRATGFARFKWRFLSSVPISPRGYERRSGRTCVGKSR
jgi:hypothetical protein